MKIYTKKGDTGNTSLIGGTRVPKHHQRIVAYGTVDELNSWIGLLRDQNIEVNEKKTLVEIQDRLFTIGSQLANDTNKSKMKLPQVLEEDILFLEKEIDLLNETLPEMKSFVLPGGHTVVSYAHVARCVCRRAEREVSLLSVNEKINPIILKYLNRLSDYLFVLARKLSVFFDVQETPWKPKM
ncbi:MAG: cob(I)yrinic acid a,c-diamide adenosyltransferase [Bacteroidetes bacterium]|nr:cob(I)yrinic acid a,c-diamide adenosyltransferase [Bacteroidota bacterium]MBV6460835.1 Cob(I)yrinic acid a,c-diamide adenosyltransferase [Flavobacteriales bacterium]WKZ75836.1 MAG: cob(I)yrinic acid a,c-diamide adenosyltransferase [Vicingaceae bacterium]MCL4816620.1 cob(I)yrinic acid a,c-diamide adenosyltransferase [Flavobacteriales bacterium]NOG95664.1 cob(I)yrinic acid a,c-diamide adenosyltransferase [Bacteroidota bacterium]